MKKILICDEEEFAMIEEMLEVACATADSWLEMMNLKEDSQQAHRELLEKIATYAQVPNWLSLPGTVIEHEEGDDFTMVAIIKKLNDLD